MIVHWGVLRFMRKEVEAKTFIIVLALIFDAVVLAAFTVMKLQSDPAIVLYAVIAITSVFAFQRVYLSRWTAPQPGNDH
jgi:hypothetical protein